MSSVSIASHSDLLRRICSAGLLERQQYDVDLSHIPHTFTDRLGRLPSIRLIMSNSIEEGSIPSETAATSDR